MNDEEKQKLILDQWTKEGLAKGWTQAHARWKLLKNDYDELIEEYEKQKKEIERLCNALNEAIERNSKAIEYIQDRYDGEALTHTFDKCNVKELLEILQGSDKE